MSLVKTLAVSAFVFGLAGVAWATEPASCGASLDGVGRSVTLKAPLLEADRMALSGAVFLALNDSTGQGEWPQAQIAEAPACRLATFKADGVTWTISGGAGDAPPRWARAPGREEFYFLAVGPGLEDALAWTSSRRGTLTLTRPPAYYLVGVVGETHFLFRIYDAAPGGKLLADDLAAVIDGRTAPLAAYDPGGDAVSLFIETESGRLAELLRPGLIDGQRTATLYGPDGAYFVVGEHDEMLMRGSKLPCASEYGAFKRDRLYVLDTRDETMDLACRFSTEGSWMTIFSSRSPDSKRDRRNFEAQLKEAQADGGVTQRITRGVDRGPYGDWAGAIWLDNSKMLQALWFTRRGDYVLELRATFTSDDADAVVHAATDLLTGELPKPPAADDGAG